MIETLAIPRTFKSTARGTSDQTLARSEAGASRVSDLLVALQSPRKSRRRPILASLWVAVTGASPPPLEDPLGTRLKTRGQETSHESA